MQNNDEFEIILYEKPDGTIPVQEFIDSLDKKMRVKVIGTVDLLRKNGYNLREPYSKYLDDGILELRIKLGSDISRVLYFFIVDQKVVLTNGFIKKRTKLRQRR